jgi:hypothetical protein
LFELRLAMMGAVASSSASSAAAAAWRASHLVVAAAASVAAASTLHQPAACPPALELVDLHAFADVTAVINGRPGRWLAKRR